MNPLRAATAVLVALAPFAPAPAHAGAPEGLRCGYSTMLDPRDPTNGRKYVFEVDGGPILLDSDPAGQPAWGSLTCSLQVYPDQRHSDPDIVRATSPVTPGAAHLAPATYEYESADVFVTLMLCTRLDIVGRDTLYWDSPNETWSTDPDSTCAFPWEGEDEPLWDEVFYDHVDPVVCPPLATVAPPEGDVDGVWDCPPYGG